MEQAIPLRKKLRIYITDTIYKKKTKLQVSDGFRVLAYHSVTDRLIKNEWQENTIPKDLFGQQMKFLSDNKYNIISCNQAVRYLAEDREIPPKTVSITFDDGYRNNYLNALPILKKYDFHATLFVTLNFLREHSADSKYLSRQELIEMKNSGIIDFGLHGLTHRILTKLDDEELSKEIIDTKRMLEDIIQDKIYLFAYPFGHNRSFNKKIVAKIQSAGFEGAFTTIFGLNNSKTNHFLMRRNRISWFDGLDGFDKHLTAAYDWCALLESFRVKRIS